MERLKDFKLEEHLGPAKKLFDYLYLAGLFFIVCAELMRTIYIFPDEYITVTVFFMELSPYILPLMFFRFLLSGAVKFDGPTVAVFGIMMTILYLKGIFHTADVDNIIMLSILVGGVNLEFRRVIKTVFAAQLFCFVSIPILYFMGVSATRIISFVRPDGTDRYAIGFLHPNQLAMQLFILIGLFFVLYFNKLRIWHFIAAEVLVIGAYLISDTRAGFVFTTILVAAFAVYSLLLRKKNFDLFNVKPLRWLAVGAFPFFTVISALMLPLAQFKRLDDISSLRLSYQMRAVNEVGLVLLRTSGNSPETDILLDNFYFYTAFYQGLIFLIAYLVIFTLLLRRLVDVNRPFALYVCALLCYFLVDHLFYWGAYTAIAPFVLTGRQFLTYTEGKPFFKKKTKVSDALPPETADEPIEAT
jgi:hypothetical protein